MIPRPSPTHSPVGRLPVSPEWPSPQAGRALRVRWPISGAGTLAAGAARRGSALTSPDRLAGREVGARRRERRSREQVPGARSGTRTRDHPLPPPPPPGPPASGYLICMLPGLACVCARAPGATGRSVGRGGGEGGPAPRRRRGGGGGARAGPRPSVRTPVAPPSPPSAPAGNKGERAGSQGLDAPAHQSPSLSL